MDRRIGLKIACSLFLLLLCIEARGPPHSSVQQQVNLIIDGEEIKIRAKISIPISPDKNMEAVQHLKQRGLDISVLAKDIFRDSDLVIDGRQAHLKIVSASINPVDIAASEFKGPVFVEAIAVAKNSKSLPNHVSYEMNYHKFSDKWFIQPFLRNEFAEVTHIEISERRRAGVSLVLREILE